MAHSSRNQGWVKNTVVIRRRKKAKIRINGLFIYETCKDVIRQAKYNTKRDVDRENKRMISIHNPSLRNQRRDRETVIAHQGNKDRIM